MTPLTDKERERLAVFAGLEKITPQQLNRDWGQPALYLPVPAAIEGETAHKFMCNENDWLPGDLSDVPWWQIQLLLDAVRERGDLLTIEQFTESYTVYSLSTGRAIDGDSIPLALCRAFLEMEE